MIICKKCKKTDGLELLLERDANLYHHLNNKTNLFNRIENPFETNYGNVKSATLICCNCGYEEELNINNVSDYMDKINFDENQIETNTLELLIDKEFDDDDSYYEDIEEINDNAYND